MDWLVKLFYLCVFFFGVSAQTWTDPFISDPVNEHVIFTVLPSYFEVKMDEEVLELEIGILEYKGKASDITINAAPPAMGLVAQCDGTENCKLVVINKMDFEANLEPSYRIFIKIGSIEKSILIEVVNIDDNPSYMQLNNPNGCSVEELSPVGLSDCKYTLTDADGFLEKPTMTVIEEEGSIIGELFEFKLDKDVSGADKSVGVTLNIITADLDYDQRSLYIFQVDISRDTASQNQFRVLIEIVDMPNKPPIWEEIRSLYQVTEEEAETILNLKARDGDMVINEPIGYRIEGLEETWSDFIMIDDPLVGKIKVLGINRDQAYFDATSSIPFQVVAYEKAYPDVWKTDPYDVSLIIDDIDDENPEITLEGGTVGNLFRICEGRNVPIPNLKLSVHDKDVGENARYTVKLEDNQYSKAFKIVPESGYQKLDFLLTIDDSTLLDFEEDGWKTFAFNIQSRGNDENMQDSETIQFELINWNDEVPVFVDDSTLTPNVLETVKANHIVTTVVAIDKDGDNVRYSLPTGMLSILDITDDGVITTKVDNVFDFERQDTLLLYVTAYDDFSGDEEGCNPQSNPVNSVTVIVTVTITDVNDETPVLNAIINEDITIMENSDDGTEINYGSNIIEATDADISSNLIFEIEWENSRATKNGARLTPNNFDLYVKDFLTVEIDSPLPFEKAVPKFKTIEKDTANPGQSPDYEKFDTVILKLRVTDTDQDEANGRNYATADITFLIGDKNDNIPIFVLESIKPRTVIENAADTITLGRILAIDDDGVGFNEVQYKLFEEDGVTPAEKITINESNGELSVVNKSPPESNIDCDPDIELITFTVVASDPEGKQNEAKIEILIIDVNDEPPKLADTALTVEIDEEMAIDSEVIASISVTDLDRDDRNRNVKISISNVAATAYFNVNEDSGQVTVKGRIDRETIPNNPIVINIIAMDNGGISGLSDVGTITITVKDTNDNSPEIKTTELSATEEFVSGDTIDSIIVEDLDEGDNSAVSLEIIEVTSPKGEKMDDYFSLSAPVQNGHSSTFTLSALDSLRGYHGAINIKLKATDKGPTGQGSVPQESDLTLNVEMFNFESPTIEFPVNGQTYYLKLAEEDQLVELVQGQALDPFRGNDGQGGSKYQVQFKLLDPLSTETNELANEIVKFTNGHIGTSGANLRIKKKPDVDINYELKINAINIGGIPPKSTDISVNLMFIDEEAQPKFVIDVATEEIEENDPDALIDNLPVASYGGVANPLEVFYYIQNPSTVPFKIAKKSTENKYQIIIDTDKYPNGLDREAENGDKYIFIIMAARTSDPPSGEPAAGSKLTVTINILNKNDNSPEFETSQYYAALVNTLTLQSEVFRIKATDLDGAEDTLTYKIENAVGHGDVGAVSDPFELGMSSDECVVKLKFGVTKAMEGYFDVTFSVTDSLEGKNNKDVTKAQVYIVSELHRMDFKFINSVDEVVVKIPEIMVILNEIFEYQSVVERYNTETEDDVALTVLSVYFIDLSEQQPVLKTTIIEIANIVTVNSNLIGQLNTLGLTLKSFVDNLVYPEDLSEYYKTWLIGVAAVMGVLITFLIIASTFKYLGMKKQITRLTGRNFGSIDSGLNRKAAPNTNNHTFDGANPIFSNNEKQPEMPDTASMSSGDSELYGVENNPVFSNNVEKY